jgi:hypothetical protein
MLKYPVLNRMSIGMERRERDQHVGEQPEKIVLAVDWLRLSSGR